MNNQTIEPEIGPCALCGCHGDLYDIENMTISAGCPNINCPLYATYMLPEAWNRLSRLAEQERLSQGTLEMAKFALEMYDATATSAPITQRMVDDFNAPHRSSR